MTYGQIIRAKRKSYDRTLDLVAHRIGSHKGYVSGIENGRVRPPRDKITAKLCTFLNLPLTPMLILSHCEKAPKAIRAQMHLLCKAAIQEVTG